MLPMYLVLNFPTSTDFFTSSFSETSDPPILPSFPTRRSSDLDVGRCVDDDIEVLRRAVDVGVVVVEPRLEVPRVARSEEHTSELQSRRDIVCRLLLEKKNF